MNWLKGLLVQPLFWRPWSLGLMVCALAACSTPAAVQHTSGDTHWSGRLALTVHSEPEQRYSAGFDLSGSPQMGELLLHSPLGQTLARLRWDAQGAQWQQGEQVIQRASLDLLTAELGEGVAMPVAAMFGWLSGQPGQSSGWEADLSQQAQGRIVAKRHHPLPSAELRLIFNR